MAHASTFSPKGLLQASFPPRPGSKPPRPCPFYPVFALSGQGDITARIFAPPTLDCAPAYVTRHCLTGRSVVGAAVQTLPPSIQTLPLSRPSCIGHTLALESNDHLRLRLSGHSQPSRCLHIRRLAPYQCVCLG